TSIRCCKAAGGSEPEDETRRRRAAPPLLLVEARVRRGRATAAGEKILDGCSSSGRSRPAHTERKFHSHSALTIKIRHWFHHALSAPHPSPLKRWNWHAQTRRAAVCVPCWRRVAVCTPCWRRAAVRVPCWRRVAVCSPCWRRAAVWVPCCRRAAVRVPCCRRAAVRATRRRGRLRSGLRGPFSGRGNPHRVRAAGGGAAAGRFGRRRPLGPLAGGVAAEHAGAGRLLRFGRGGQAAGGRAAGERPAHADLAGAGGRPPRCRTPRSPPSRATPEPRSTGRWLTPSGRIMRPPTPWSWPEP